MGAVDQTSLHHGIRIKGAVDDCAWISSGSLQHVFNFLAKFALFRHGVSSFNAEQLPSVVPRHPMHLSRNSAGLTAHVVTTVTADRNACCVTSSDKRISIVPIQMAGCCVMAPPLP